MSQKAKGFKRRTKVYKFISPEGKETVVYGGFKPFLRQHRLGERIRRVICKSEKKRLESRGNKVKIGLLGGSFSPITKAHIEIARCALKTLDKIIFVPCNNHPWGKSLIDFKHRFKMCKLAVEKNMFVKDFEVRYKLPGDTFSLINRLKKIPYYKKIDMFFIIGMDEANNIKKWKNYKQLIRLIKFIVIPRENVEIKQRNAWYLKPPHMLLVPETPIPGISSTSVRINLKKFYGNNPKEAKELLSKQLNPEVFEYIKSHKLYK